MANIVNKVRQLINRKNTIAFFIILFLAVSLISIFSYTTDQENKQTSFSEASETTAYAGYFVDSVSGSDSNAGSFSAPWKTLSALRNRTFVPGDIINLKKGSRWTTGLKITSSGTEEKPIIFQAYGDGENPVIENPGTNDNWTFGVEILANWVIVRNVTVKNTYYGFKLGDADNTSIGNHNIVENSEITNSGFGVNIFGEYNRVSNNKIHDLVMAVNTPKDVNPDDDTGAAGIHIYNSNNEISYNHMYNCRAPSYDYGEDGGGIELYASKRPLDNNYIHHNWVNDSNEFMEIGGNKSSNQTAYNNVFSYNVSINNRGLGYIHMKGGSTNYAVDVKNFKFENNTVVEDDGVGTWAVLGFSGQPTSDAFYLKNNIIYVKNIPRFSNYGTFTHENNLYYWIGDTTDIGYNKATSEIVGQNPLFIDPGTSRNFKLQQNSPAVDKGVSVGLAQDFDNNAVPYNSIPDIGAYEYSGANTPTSVPSPSPSSTPSPTPKPIQSTPIPQPTKPLATPTRTPTSYPSPTIIIPSPTPTKIGSCPACSSYVKASKYRSFFGRYYARITWDGVSNAEGYRVYKCIGSYCIPNTLIATVGSSTRQYTDSNSRIGYRRGTSVTYSIRPYKSNCSAPSCIIISITF